ncbi:hypothetical protein [Vibrio coralliilyticus]|uniref:hypothetical protein n=1 Tax=Vibrio coralliilyticus TaxID=190893 RepID=UPI0015606186|nr:hypothetical protein [Vibrio coralliilyticus]NRF28259.1 hypothetical protein [Vibrio coralliilyticus]NRF51930.1 hypothetical protein [Vibrio coralliilyticus]NRG05559.1 hypothetical protein [Vibrio coralliilyticus]
MKKIILTLMLFSFSTYSFAYTCAGNVKGVSIEPTTGDVLVEKIGPLTWPRLCSVSNERNGVSTEACKAVYSTLLTAQASNKQVTLWFRDSKSCEEQVSWQLLTGWYFGPSLNN